MLDVGTQNNDKLDMPDIDEYYFNIDFSHNGKKIKLILTQYMALQKTDNNFSILDVQSQLESIDRIRSPLTVAIKELNEYKDNKELIFDTWYARKSENYRIEIAEDRLEMKKTRGFAASNFQGITKDDIRNRILISDMEEDKETELTDSEYYLQSQKEINHITYNINLLTSLRNDLEKRAFTLQALLKSLSDEKRGYAQRNEQQI